MHEPKKLEEMIIYLIICAGRKSETILPLVEELAQKCKKIYVIPTDNTKKLFSIPKFKGLKNVQVINDYSNNIEEEDLVLVAPCTFNTFNKMVLGIADNYALSILAASIGKKKNIYLALSMNNALWQNPVIEKNLTCLDSNYISVIWPDEKENGEKTMASFGKILDYIYVRFSRLKYPLKQAKGSKENFELINSNYKMLSKLGHKVFSNSFTHADKGCIALKVNNGFIVTTTGSCLGTLKKDDFSYIPLSKSKPLIHWIGKKKPSCETPMFYEIFRQMPEVKCIVHTHAKIITLSKKFSAFSTKQYIRYGLPKTGNAVVPLLKKHNFCILKDHGEIFVGKNPADCLKKIKNTVKDNLLNHLN